MVGLWRGPTAIMSEPPASTKHSAVSGIIGIPPGFHCVTMGRLKSQPRRTSAPRAATAVPAMTGTRSKKPIELLWRPDGLSATTLGFAILRVGPKTYARSSDMAILPGDGFSITEKTTCRSAVGQRRQPHRGFRALLHAATGA